MEFHGQVFPQAQVFLVDQMMLVGMEKDGSPLVQD